MINYREIAETALALIKDAGAEYAISRTPSTVTAATGAVVSGEPTTGTVWAVKLPASQGTIQAFDIRIEDNSLVGRELRFLKVAALGAPFIPRKGDVITMDDGDWEALGCTPICPADVALVFNVGAVKL